MQVSLVETNANSHIVSSDNMKPQLNLFNTLTGAKNSFVAIIYNKVDRLIESF